MSMRQETHEPPALIRHGRKPGDFTADSRVLVLIGMALIVGSLGAGSAWVLLKLISLVTNIVWLGRFSVEHASPAEATPGLWMVAAPAVGGLIIGLMSRFGS